MPRHPNPQAALAAPALIGPAEAEAIDAGAAAGTAVLDAEAIFADMVERGGGEALMIAGRIQAATAAATVADSIVASQYELLKQSKGYIGLPYRDASGERRRVATLEEYCSVFLGRSARRCREIAANRRLLGEDLYAAAEQVGFRQSDYRALQALPADDAEAVKVALESDKPQESLDLLAKVIARQQEQKAAAEDRARVAEGERDEARADYEAVSTLYGQAKAKLKRIEGGDFTPPRLDEQMSAWPVGAGALIQECRRHLTQLGLIIQGAEAVDIPPEGTPEADIHQRAMRLLYDGAAPGLRQLADEVSGVLIHLERIVGACAYPNEDAPVQDGAPI